MAADKSQAPPSTEADVSNPIVHAVKAAAGGTGIIVGTAVVAILVATITRPFCSNNLVGFWSCIAATILVPRFEELEALALTGELPPTNKRLARTATPMMKFWMYAGTAVNVWWLCRLVMENPKEVVAWHLAMAFTLTDIVSGVYHWFQDSYRSKDPELNAALFDNFQIHHELPYLICKHEVEYVSWELAAGCLCAHVLAELHGMIDGYYSGFFFGFRSFWICGMWINHVHRLAHMPLGKGMAVPWPLQSRKHHSMHHERPELKSYCIFSVCNNWWMDALRVWEGIEWLIYKGFGAVSFRMAVDDPERYQRASNFALDDVVREQALRAKIAAMNENASDAAAAAAAQEEEVSSK